jgi:uncharacterized protein YjiS (DUF1127 family)
MTAIHWHSPHGRVRQHNAVGALNDAANQVVATLREWRRRARDRSRLAELDERTLQDIGLTRADAEFLINKPFWRK